FFFFFNIKTIPFVKVFSNIKFYKNHLKYVLLGYKNFLNEEYILVVVFIAIDKRQTQRIYFRGMHEI
ncbi:hypothetical protein CRB84_004527, partial [Salmonella enterica subsp. enterica serovar Enteritidis]|nr:hypothetical protein [Salmonella enterica subsp. enterica serovar Enteritidis]